MMGSDKLICVVTFVHVGNPYMPIPSLQCVCFPLHHITM